jgi:hypothetical protein
MSKQIQQSGKERTPQKYIKRKKISAKAKSKAKAPQAAPAAA